MRHALILAVLHVLVDANLADAKTLGDISATTSITRKLSLSLRSARTNNVLPQARYIKQQSFPEGDKRSKGNMVESSDKVADETTTKTADGVSPARRASRRLLHRQQELRCSHLGLDEALDDDNVSFIYQCSMHARLHEHQVRRPAR